MNLKDISKLLSAQWVRAFPIMHFVEMDFSVQWYSYSKCYKTNSKYIKKKIQNAF